MRATSPDNATPRSFWFLGAALVLYVAACTGFRANVLTADAWEHHRAVLELTRHFWHPGNPTFAVDIPSVRYSPYTVALAALCRIAHIDPYNALSIAAVLNTVLLILGLWLLLRAYGEAASAAAVLFVMVALYGTAPGYANSYALADLPWHQVNPSAFSFGLTLLSWAILRRMIDRARPSPLCLLVPPLLACATLDHAMTGAFAVMGLLLMSFTAPPPTRRPIFLCVALCALAAAALCLLWPWYSPLAVLRSNLDRDFWFNPYILKFMLTRWCAPAMFCVLFVLPLWRRPLVHFALIGGAAAFLIGIASYPLRSALMARFPLPGLIFLHIPIGIFVHQSAILRPRTWPARLRSLFAPPAQSAAPIAQTAVAAVLLFCLIPQLTLVASEPHLARAYIAKALHRRDKQRDPRAQLAGLLGDVAPDDVVLSDLQTSWIIPSIRGKIVSALHYELLVPDQPRRAADLQAFFGDPDESRRAAILAKYHVRWILLNADELDLATFTSLFRPRAVVAHTGKMFLMDARTWLALGSPRT